MFKSLIYKEWIKTRWFMSGYLLLGLVLIGYIFLTVQHDFKFLEGKNYWNKVLFLNLNFFSAFKFIPLVGGFVLGISQFFPETVDKRIKLTYHLPLNENKALLQMMSFGAIILMGVYSCLFLLFSLLSSVFFPKEMVQTFIVTILPWFLAGFSAYFLIGLVVLEPIWKYRIFYFAIGSFFTAFFLKSSIMGAYGPINPTLAVCSFALCIVLLFSGYRFRKGEM